MSEVHLVKVPLRADKFMSIARRRGLRLRDLDEGYACHCFLRELWQDAAPAPFVVAPRGRLLEVWGYSRLDAAELQDHARAFADPSLLTVLQDLESIVSKSMPTFEAGRRLGFTVRACPVVRLAKPMNGHAVGAEVDAFLARCFAAGSDAVVSREDVYRDWLITRVGNPDRSGATVEAVRVVAFSRERLVRRTQGSDRHACRLERPDVRFEGNLVVVDSMRFHVQLARGVGRHRAFGFGALMLMPPRGGERKPA